MSVQVTTLSNGIRVVSDQMDRVETISVGVWVDVGARFERPSVNGVSHVLEHMAFKGTDRRSALDIASEMDAVGGHLNAYTGRDTTAYYAKILKEDLPLAVDIVADILQNPTMTPDELERERGVIIQEIHQANDTPDDQIFDFFQQTAYPDQALGRPVLGTVELVQGMGRDAILGYMRDHYSGPKMILSAAGNIGHNQLVDLANDAFGDLPDRIDHTPEAAVYAGGDYRAEKKLEQAHVVLGLDGVSFTDPDYYAASVYTTLIGGGMSSRLFQEVREKRGLAYSIYAFSSSYNDGGTFGVYAGTGPDELQQLMPIVCEQLTNVTDDVSEEEVARARAQLKASVLMSMESTSARCEGLARQLQVYGRPISVEELVADIDAVDVASVKRFAKRLLTSTPTVVAVGPVGGLESSDSIAARLS